MSSDLQLVQTNVIAKIQVLIPQLASKKDQRLRKRHQISCSQRWQKSQWFIEKRGRWRTQRRNELSRHFAVSHSRTLMPRRPFFCTNLKRRGLTFLIALVIPQRQAVRGKPFINFGEKRRKEVRQETQEKQESVGEKLQRITKLNLHSCHISMEQVIF